MANLYDILAGSQNGQAIVELGRAFGLSQEQTESAVAALLPAISMGLKRTTATPEGLGDLLGLMGRQSTLYAMYDNPRAAFSAEGIAAGNEALARMFGSPDASRAIADRAQHFSGITSGILKKLLPILAGILISGLMRSKSGKAAPQPAPQPQADAGGGGVLVDILRQIFGQAAGGQTAPAGPTKSPIPPLKDILGPERGGAPSPIPREVPSSQQSPAPSGQQSPAPGGQPGPAPTDPGSDLMVVILRELEKAIKEGRLKPVVIGPVEIGIPGQANPGQAAPGQAQPSPGGTDIFGQILREILGGAGAQAGRQGAGAAVFGDLIEPGQKATQKERDAFQEVLDNFLGGARR
jgi:hypothetical protein